MMNLDKLVALNPPFAHLLLGTPEDMLAVYRKLADNENAVVKVNGYNCKNVDGLFEEFAGSFQFPDYFGKNWAAFDECINDLYWLPSKAYILLISNVTEILIDSDKEYRILIKILINAMKEWTNGRSFDSFPTPPTPPMPFHIVFQCTHDKGDEVRVRLGRSGLEDIGLITPPF